MPVLRGGQRVDGVVATEPADDEDEQPHEDEGPADVSERLASFSDGEVQRGCEHHEHEDEHPHADAPYGLHGLLDSPS